MKRLRILCLHGYHGNADVMRDQMRALVTGTETLAEYVCVDAPSLAAGDFGWWHAVDDPNATNRGDPGVDGKVKYYKGWSRTRDWLVSVFARQGPFDGVFGFSQGAALTGLLVGLRAPGGVTTAEHPLAFDFAVVVSGFRSNDASHAALYASKESFDLPSLHFIGRSDFVVPPAESFDLASAFASPTILQHGGGHVIASTSEIRDRYRRFLEEMRQKPATSPAGDTPSDMHRPTAAPTSPLEVPLWSGREHPSMTVVFPQGGTAKPKPALLVFQGGAYSTCFGSGGGSAEWLAKQGIVGIRVEYGTRSTGESYPANYADAARALRLVRRRAAEWNIDPDRIGVVGYSAGGHLASLLSTQPSLYADRNDDLAGSVSARPNLVVLGYPLISFVEQYNPGAFVGSTENFFGRRNVEERERRAFSNELHVDRTHPPVFIWTTRDDALVPYTHSKLFAEALQRAGVQVRYELYPHGPHGLGLALQETSEVGAWTGHLVEWLRAQWGAF
jgi:acetyl esterase/lipase